MTPPATGAAPLPTAQAAGRAEPLRILHLLAPARVGGLERVVHTLATGHLAAGHHVAVLAVLSEAAEDHPFVAGLQAAGVEVWTERVSARSYRLERARVAAHIRRWRPDIVHTHGYRPDVVDGGVARRLGVPLVTTSHGFIGGSRKARLYEWLQRRAFRRFDAVVAVSRSMAEWLIRDGVPAGRVVVLPNAWPEGRPPLERGEARARLGLGDGFQIGWLGRLTPEKGADVLLKALALLPSRDWTASLIGTGSDADALQILAADLGIGSQVRWHGLLPEAAQLLGAFDLLVISSRTEGTPISLFETMSAGVPLVTTSVGGIPDVVSPAEALLVLPDDARAVADAIEAVQHDPAAATARAEAARLRLEHYRPAPWLARYERLYRSLNPEAFR